MSPIRREWRCYISRSVTRVNPSSRKHAFASILLLGGFLSFPQGGSRHTGAILFDGSLLERITLALTVVGMTVAPAPPSPQAMAATSLATLALVVGAAGWLGRRRSAG